MFIQTIDNVKQWINGNLVLPVTFILEKSIRTLILKGAVMNYMSIYIKKKNCRKFVRKRLVLP